MRVVLMVMLCLVPLLALSRAYVEWCPSQRALDMQAVTVKVDMPDRWGSGVAIKYRGEVLILTAAHVVEGQTSITAMWDGPAGGECVASLEVVRKSDTLDLALCRPDRPFYENARLADALPPIGGQVYHYGACYGQLSFTTGHASRAIIDIDGQEYTQLTGLASPGSSGGGVFDRYGRLCGVISRAAPGQFGWAVPIHVIKEWLDGSDE